MKILHKDVYAIILQLTKSSVKMTIPSLSRLSQEITEIYQFEDSERLKPVFKYELKQYKRKKSNAGFEDKEVLLHTDEFKAVR